MDAFKVTNRHYNTANNLVNNWLTFNKENGTQIFVVASGSGSASVSDVNFTCGNRGMYISTSASSVEVNAGDSTKITVNKSGRYILCFSVFLADDDVSSPNLTVKLAKNGTGGWKTAEAKGMDLGVWTDYYIDFTLADKDYVVFSWSTNSAFYVDEIGLYCDDRGMMLPPIYSEPYKSIPSGTGLADGVYNITATEGINQFTIVESEE